MYMLSCDVKRFAETYLPMVESTTVSSIRINARSLPVCSIRRFWEIIEAHLHVGSRDIVSSVPLQSNPISLASYIFV